MKIDFVHPSVDGGVAIVLAGLTIGGFWGRYQHVFSRASRAIVTLTTVVQKPSIDVE